ncbi:MAG TPA: class I SAM-dependent methyltransferase [Anaerolineaceae bacterium]|nr:class I SAM-dependent methyltransferase [Anaerolineaceae bacterium]
MSVYDRFADVYASGPYMAYSQSMLEHFPRLQERYGLPTGGNLLDLACGTGAFAVGMASLGWQVTGYDQSAEMLKHARQRAAEAGSAIAWLQGDLRAMDFEEQFDLATCWFDSLNYILSEEELQHVFRSVWWALKPGGWFVFDMNTVYGLAIGWTRQKWYVQTETPDLLEVHENSYDYEKNIGQMRIICFQRQGGLWDRFEEVHCERAFQVTAIQSALECSGLRVEAVLGKISDLTPYQPENTRVFFVCQKPPAGAWNAK